MKSRPKRSGARPKTFPAKLTQREFSELLKLGENFPPPPPLDRPKMRGECRGTARPCPWVSCKYHLYLDVDPSSGTLRLNFPDLEPDQLHPSCSLDVAEEDCQILDEVGKYVNLTRERVRQIEIPALRKLKVTMEKEE